MVCDILFFVRTSSSQYRLVNEFVDFEQLGFSFEDLYLAVKQLKFEVIQPCQGFGLWKGFLEVSPNNEQLNLEKIKFYPDDLRVLNGSVINLLFNSSIYIKLVFTVRLCLFFRS